MTIAQKYWRSLLAALATLATTASAHAAPTDVLSQQLCKEAVPYVAKAFAGVLARDSRAGVCLAGDFNGDGKPDVFMVVKVLVAKVPAAAGITTIHPFSKDDDGKGRVQFLALHSSANTALAGWAHYDKLLLDGSSPVMVLRHKDIASDMERITQRSKEVKELQLPRRALRGEAIYLGTEAVSAILYWNGKSYVFHEDPAGP